MNINWEGLSPISGDVLVIEDDPTLRTLMTDILTEIGAHSLAFETADDAITYLLETQGQCILVIADQGLPGQIQGAEFIEKVRSKWPSIASILTSGYELKPSEIPSSTVYLHKPWGLDDLVIAIAGLLQPGNPIHKH
ncbi:response regulator [Pseudomonas sp. NPDC086251]|uniref:response regulator n=1 Tax=Pseudomonas sp. NPDC086251 TaxID=3364431 RepID=UPI0038360A67